VEGWVALRGYARDAEGSGAGEVYGAGERVLVLVILRGWLVRSGLVAIGTVLDDGIRVDVVYLPPVLLCVHPSGRSQCSCACRWSRDN